MGGFSLVMFDCQKDPKLYIFGERTEHHILMCFAQNCWWVFPFVTGGHPTTVQSYLWNKSWIIRYTPQQIKHGDAPRSTHDTSTVFPPCFFRPVCHSRGSWKWLGAWSMHPPWGKWGLQPPGNRESKKQDFARPLVVDVSNTNKKNKNPTKSVSENEQKTMVNTPKFTHKICGFTK